MPGALILNAFTGDHSSRWRNRQPNEILFTAVNERGFSPSVIQPGGILVTLLAPASRPLQVTSVFRDGEVFHATLARFSDEPAIHSGVYLASLFVVASNIAETFSAAAIASVPIDEDLAVIERPLPDPTLDAEAV